MANPTGKKINEKISKKEMMDMMKAKRQKEFDKKNSDSKKKQGQGGPASKAAPKFNKDGIRIFSGTGSTTPNQKFPDVKFSKGMANKAVVKPKPTPKATPKVKIPSMISKVTPKPKYTQLPRKTK
jgi:hypothetical protein